MLNLLQSLETSTKDNQSQYGFLYESLVTRSLVSAKVKYGSSAGLDIDTHIMSLLAYKMLKAKKEHFSYQLFETTVAEFTNTKMVEVCSKDLYNRMIAAHIIVETREKNIFTFKYPYMLYYFTGTMI